MAFLDEKDLKQLSTSIKKNKYDCKNNEKIISLEKIVEVLRKLSRGLSNNASGCDGSMAGSLSGNGLERSGEKIMLSGIKSSGNNLSSGIKESPNDNSDNDFFQSDYEDDLSEVMQKIRLRVRDLDDNEDLQESYKNLIQNCGEDLISCRTNLEIDDSELDVLINKLESLVWRANARAILDRNDEGEQELAKILSQAPREIIKEGCREFSQVKERVHAIQAAISNEQRILARLSEYWEFENLGDSIEEVRQFVEETRNYILNKKIERQLEILEQVATALTPENASYN